jgi:hypothetical protein
VPHASFAKIVDVDLAEKRLHFATAATYEIPSRF